LDAVDGSDVIRREAKLAGGRGEGLKRNSGVRKDLRVQMVDATLACKSTCRSLESSRKRSFDQVELPLESTPEKDVGPSLRS
jgi:hypothetical protein